MHTKNTLTVACANPSLAQPPSNGNCRFRKHHPYKETISVPFLCERVSLGFSSGLLASLSSRASTAGPRAMCPRQKATLTSTASRNRPTPVLCPTCSSKDVDAIGGQAGGGPEPPLVGLGDVGLHCSWGCQRDAHHHPVVLVAVAVQAPVWDVHRGVEQGERPALLLVGSNERLVLQQGSGQGFSQ
jgi:hypothetical protein